MKDESLIYLREQSLSLVQVSLATVEEVLQTHVHRSVKLSSAGISFFRHMSYGMLSSIPLNPLFPQRNGVFLRHDDLLNEHFDPRLESRNLRLQGVDSVFVTPASQYHAEEINVCLSILQVEEIMFLEFYASL